MPKEIRINHPGDGDWIMGLGEGVFRPGADHSLVTHDGGKRLGGFVLNHFLGNSIAVHMSSTDPGWCSRDLLWMLFDYVFNQLKCGKLLALVPSDNYHAIELDMRCGFVMETHVKDAYGPGRHLIVLVMTRDKCRWLALRPKRYQPGTRFAA